MKTYVNMIKILAVLNKELMQTCIIESHSKPSLAGEPFILITY